MTPRNDDLKWKILFLLWALHFGTALIAPLSDLSDALRPRAVVLLIPLFGLCASLWMLYLSAKKRIHFQPTPQIRDRFLILSILLLLIRIILWGCEVLFTGDLSLYRGYLEILAPASNPLGYAVFESALLLGFFSLRDAEIKPLISRSMLQKLLIVFIILAALFGLVSMTRIGIAVTHQGDWGRGQPAVPLLEWHILLACLFCIRIAWWEVKDGSSTPFLQTELFICFAIYLSAAVLWISQPVIPSASALEPRAPNYEIYPFIDSLTYDEFAQSALVGEGFNRDIIPQRPLYIVFLTLAHTLVGQGYGSVIVLQSLLLAFFPVLLYLFGRDFFGRPVGVSIAVLAILRDHLMNLVAPITGNASYSKLYLSEIPTAIGLLLFVWLVMRWVHSGFPNFLAFLLGGVLGFSMLIRTQAVVALPVLVLFAILSSPRSWMRIMRHAFLIALISFAMLVPWLLRNWQLTGQFVFDSPESQTANLALRYGYLEQTDTNIERLPAESNAEYSTRLKEMARASIMKDPMLAMWGIANSFFNHGVNNILVFPLREKIETSGELFVPAEPFWQKWEGAPATPQIFVILFYIFLIGLGLTLAWQRNGWLGLMPLALNLIYNLWTSLALLSGQRFMLTMDWSIYTYSIIGLFACIGFVFYLVTGTRPLVAAWVEKNFTPKKLVPPQASFSNYAYWGSLFFMVGFSLYATERIFPQRYPPLPQGQLPASLEQFITSEADPAVAACLTHADFNLVQGRALYPRYYAAGDGESFTDAFGYKKADEGRIVFSMVGQQSGRVVFPLDEVPPFFPHAADVTLVYDGENLNFIFVQLNDQEYLYPSPKLDPLTCPLK